MDQFNFELNKIEEQMKLTSIKYDFCLSKVLEQYLKSDDDFDFLHKPCDVHKKEISKLMKEYVKFDQKNKNILENS